MCSVLFVRRRWFQIQNIHLILWAGCRSQRMFVILAEEITFPPMLASLTVCTSNYAKTLQKDFLHTRWCRGAWAKQVYSGFIHSTKQKCLYPLVYCAASCERLAAADPFTKQLQHQNGRFLFWKLLLDILHTPLSTFSMKHVNKCAGFSLAWDPGKHQFEASRHETNVHVIECDQNPKLCFPPSNTPTNYHKHNSVFVIIMSTAVLNFPFKEDTLTAPRPRHHSPWCFPCSVKATILDLSHPGTSLYQTHHCPSQCPQCVQRTTEDVITGGWMTGPVSVGEGLGSSRLSL